MIHSAFRSFICPCPHPVSRVFDGTYSNDLDVDAVTDLIRFFKPPFEAELMCHDGRRITLIGAHLKSKAPHGAKSKDEGMLISIANRRKQLAQALWIRGRVDHVLDDCAEVIVLGDLNDGPGLDVLAGGAGNDTLMGCGYYLGLNGDQSAEFMAALQAAKADPALLAQYNALTVKSDVVFINSDYSANVDLTREGLDQTDGADTLYAGEGDDVLHIATDDVTTGGGGEDEFNVHISQFVSGKPVPLIADFELTEDKIVITYDPAVMSNTTITYTPVKNGLLVNVGGASVLKLEGSYSEAQVSSRVSIVEENSTLVTT